MESGAAGKTKRVPCGTESTRQSETRSSPGAPNPCRSTTSGPSPPPSRSVPPTTRHVSPPSASVLISDGPAGVDDERVPGHVRRRVAGEVERGSGDVVRLADASERGLRDDHVL